MTDQIPNKYQEFDSVPQDLSEGPRKDRGCTDLSCCFIFFLFTALSILIAFVGLMAGNPAILAQPYDMDHQPCGIKSNTDYPFIYFPSPKNLKSNVCIKTCPVKDQKEVECLVNRICQSGKLTQDVSKSQLIYETIPVADKICIPLNQEYFKSIKTTVDIGGMEQIASDLRNTWMICSSSVFSAILLGFIFMYLVRLMAGSIVWSFVLLIFISLTTLGLLFLFQYLQLTNPPAMDKTITENSSYKAMANIMSVFKDKEQVLVAGIVLLSFALIFIVSICCICEKIRLGVQIIKASARFMTENPRITLIPIISFIISTAFFAYWFVVALYLYSSGGVSKIDGTLPFAHVYIGTDIKVLGWTHLFGLFWYESFFAACQQMIIIGAVAFWYFKADESEDSNTTLSAKLFFKNHMGTAAFGSFILGVLAFIKFIISIIAEQATSLKEKGEQNSCFSYVYKILYCFIYLFEKCFKHLNLSAYVWTMMDGKNFCPSAQRALALYVMNPIRMSLIAGIGEIFEFLGCAAICGVTTLSCYFIITKTEYYTERVDNPLAPILVIAVTSYYVGSFVMSLFGTVSEALITIFSIEEGMRTPSKKCPEELKEFMDSVDSK